MHRQSSYNQELPSQTKLLTLRFSDLDLHKVVLETVSSILANDKELMEAIIQFCTLNIQDITNGDLSPDGMALQTDIQSADDGPDWSAILHENTAFTVRLPQAAVRRHRALLEAEGEKVDSMGEKVKALEEDKWALEERIKILEEENANTDRALTAFENFTKLTREGIETLERYRTPASERYPRIGPPVPDYSVYGGTTQI